MKPFDIKAKRPLIISGPCSAETEEQTLETCRQIAATGLVDVLRAGIWKPRTKPGSFEGVGLKGLAWMSKARELTGLPIGTEVATSKHVEAALEFGVDVIWVGARTTVNPFSVQDIADALKGADVTVLIKNPMNPDIELWSGAIARMQNAGITKLGLIHRGFSAYGASLYRNNPMWHLAIEMRSRFPELPMICDPSHIGGQRDLIAPLSDQALRMNFDGLIIESHCNPDYALSDSNQQVTPDALGEILKSLNLHTDNLSQETLTDLRRQIDEIDDKLMEILAQRMSVSRQIGILKKQQNMPVVQPNRYNSLIENRVERAKDLKLGTDFVTRILEEIHEESVRQQLNI